MNEVDLAVASYFLDDNWGKDELNLMVAVSKSGKNKHITKAAAKYAEVLFEIIKACENFRKENVGDA